MRRGWFGRLVGSAAQATVAALCVFNFVMTPHFECMLDGDSCDERVSMMAGIFARSVSIACLVTAVIAWHKYNDALAEYRERAELHDAYAAPAASAKPLYVGHATYAGVVLCTCLALIVPINVFRLYRFVLDRRPVSVMVYFVLMYSQNLYVCLYETLFVRLFYKLYTRFTDLNRDMEAIGERIEDGRCARDNPPPVRGGWIPCDRDDEHRPHLYYSSATGQPLVAAVEQLRIRHRLIREAVDALKPAFAVPIGLSLCNLCVMILFDVYYHLKNAVYQPAGTWANVFIFMWLSQYTFRFFIITMTVDVTMKQAS
ncbi:uncharacterized protein LOC111042194 [Myzus persicae]|uniref:uncharacterized protein LOC111042194 n=1 Tax=Myzus persicae TaxID=13164 RepID=UPI000B939BBB|nr:uncharacterized protein LOC111042194 [Myzus persicae]